MSDSFFEKLGRSLKIEDASLADYDPDQDDLDEAKDLNDEDVNVLNELKDLPEPDATDELEIDEEMLKELSEKETEDEDEEEEFEGPIATLAVAKNNKTKIKKKPKSMPKTKQKDIVSEPSQEGRLNIDVYESEDEVVIKSAIAGVNEDDLDIDITSDMVTIRGERSHGEEISEESYFYKECYWGAFSRSVRLHTEIDPDKSEATLQNGILTIRLPKLSKTNQKKLKVKKVS